MNCANYISRFLKTHGWDVASDKIDTAPMDKHDLANCRRPTYRDYDNMLEKNEHTNDLDKDDLVALQLLKVDEPSEIAIQLPKEKVNKNNFEQCMKSSKPISPIPAGSLNKCSMILVPLKALLLIVF